MTVSDPLRGERRAGFLYDAVGFPAFAKGRGTDSRRFADGLRMTVDCSSRTADDLEAGSATARDAGICRFGTHRQAAANLTCVLRSGGRQRAYFVDGACGGYAAAALCLKADADVSAS